MAGEELTQDLRRNSVTWKIFDPWAVADWTNPTLTELNTTNERLGLDITCALDEEGTSMTLGSSEQDERLSFCDGVGKSRPGSLNPEVALAIYRDEDRAANGVFNKAFNWFRHADSLQYLVLRVGPQDSGPNPETGKLADPFNATDDIRIMSFRTDYPVDTLANGDPAILTQSPIPAGFVRWNQPPVA